MSRKLITTQQTIVKWATSANKCHKGHKGKIFWITTRVIIRSKHSLFLSRIMKNIQSILTLRISIEPRVKMSWLLNKLDTIWICQHCLLRVWNRRNRRSNQGIILVVIMKIVSCSHKIHILKRRETERELSMSRQMSRHVTHLKWD